MKELNMTILLLAVSIGLSYAQIGEGERIKSNIPEIKDSIQFVDAMNRLSMLMYERDADSTFYYARTALEISDRLDYQKGKADANNNLGVFFDIQGNFHLALKYYNKALVDYQKLKDSSNVVQATMNIAMVYGELDKDGESIERFEHALKSAEMLKNDSIKSLLIYNYLLSHPGEFTDSEYEGYIDQAQAIAQRYGDQRTLLAVSQLVADRLILKGEKEKGIRLLEHAVTTALEKQLFYVSMDMLLDLANQVGGEDPNARTEYLERGLEIAKDNEYLFYNRLFARMLYEHSAEIGNWERTLFYARELIEANDLMGELASSRNIDYIDYVLKEEQIKSLNSNYRYLSVISGLSILALLLSGIFTLFILRSLKKGKLNNKNLKNALNALEKSNQTNTDIIGFVAHDLRNPLGGIANALEVMQATGGRNDQDRTVLRMMKTSVDNALQLVDNLLHQQFRSEGLPKEPIDIGELLTYCIQMLQAKAMSKEQKIILNSEKGLFIPAQNEQLWRVFSNLITNAIKFAPFGSEVEVLARRAGSHVLVTIKDKGQGIPEEFSDAIFDMYKRGSSGTGGEESFGMGLAICRLIVEGHGGEIWFKNNRDAGTTFYVRLPNYHL